MDIVLKTMFLGDVIGYKNGDWLNKYNESKLTYESSLELLFEFIQLGGINGLDITGWKNSINYPILLSLHTLLHNNNNVETILKQFKEKFSNIIAERIAATNSKSEDITANKFKVDLSTEIAIKNNFDTSYSSDSSESNGTVWSCIIGLFDISLDKLIELSINVTRLVYTSPYGYLGGFTSAYFTYLAKKHIPMYDWPFRLIKILKSKKIKKYVMKGEKEYVDYLGFINLWNKYIETRFNNSLPIVTKSTSNVLFRSKYYYDNFAQIINQNKIIGKTGCDACIVAYDCLVDSKNNWEKLVIYAMLNPGETNVIGALSACWYVTLYGNDNIPHSQYDLATNQFISQKNVL